jgi:hypothetical protein
LAEVQEVLARSPWGDPGEASARAIHLGMRLSWASRVAANVPGARDWAAGAAAIVVAREVLVAGHRPTPGVARLADALLGPGWAQERTLRALAAALPHSARWALAGVEGPEELWWAEARFWGRVARDGTALLARPVTSEAPIVGAAAVMGADAWRVRAALEVAARGGAGHTSALEAFDAVA